MLMLATGGPFLAISVIAALAYGLVLQFRPSGVFRTLVKCLAVGALAVWSWMAGAPPLLTAGLALSTVGDAFLAGDPKRWLPPGLVSFLSAHMLYVVFFLEIGGLPVLLAQPVRLLGGGLALVLGGGLVAILWKDLGALRPAVIAYVLAISAMVGSALSLDPSRWLAMAGAVGFMASDGVLSWRLFRIGDKPAIIADHLVWWLYAGGQLAIALAFLG